MKIILELILILLLTINLMEKLNLEEILSSTSDLNEEKKVEFFSDFSQLRFVKIILFIKNEVE